MDVDNPVYKHWPVIETMPEGWAVDKTAGSPLHGYDFVTNCKNPLNGQKRALLRSSKKCLRVVTPCENNKPQIEKKEIKKPTQVIDKDYRHTLNNLARKKMQENLLHDIRVDLMICEIEGWNKLEYINEIKNLIVGIAITQGGQPCI